MAGDLLTGLEIQPLMTRKITAETCQHFGYGIAEYKGQRVQVANYYDKDRNLVGQKVRMAGKKFTVKGDLKEALPFGSHAFPKTGKKIVLTEGEIDALSMSQVQNNKWPVVSIPNGAQSAKKHVADNLEYYRGFDEVIVMFDMDEPGREAAQAVAQVLGHRAKIAELPLKDANEMLLAGRVEELTTAMWRAKEYRPEGIVELSSLKDKVKEVPLEGLSWWSPSLSHHTYGIRLGELVALGAGTGVGKSDFITQQVAHFLTVHKEDVGVFMLEQGVVETAKRVAGKVAGKPFHIPNAGWTESDLESAWSSLHGGGKLYLYDSFGANEWDSIREKIEYLHHSYGVRYFFLDHLTALAAAEEDEKTALEKIMAEMGALVKRLNIWLCFVSHLATPEKGSHEEGARVTIRQFKGSRSIGFWSSYMIGLERNQQAENVEDRHTTTLRVLKDRFTGRATGATFYLGYDSETGLLFEKAAPSGEDAASHFDTEGDF